MTDKVTIGDWTEHEFDDIYIRIYKDRLKCQINIDNFYFTFNGSAEELIEALDNKKWEEIKRRILIIVDHIQGLAKEKK